MSTASLREAAERLADEWESGLPDGEHCQRMDAACAAIRVALAEPEPERDCLRLGFDALAALVREEYPNGLRLSEIADTWRPTFSGTVTAKLEIPVHHLKAAFAFIYEKALADWQAAQAAADVGTSQP